MAWRGLRTFYPEMMAGLVAAAERDTGDQRFMSVTTDHSSTQNRNTIFTSGR
jgi:hypothetical protein